MKTTFPWALFHDSSTGLKVDTLLRLCNYAKALLWVSVLTFAMAYLSCKNDRPNIIKDELKVPRMEDVLNGNNPALVTLVNKVRGSVGRRGPGSKTIWSRKNVHGLGLYISANHVYGLGWSSRNAQVFDLHAENMGIFETSQIPPVNGDLALGKTLIADFPLMHFDISASATNTSLLPSQDFYLGIIDNQRVEQGPLSKHPEMVKTNVPLQMHDPVNRTNASQTWAVAIAGEQAVGVGYPQDRSNYPNGAVAYGKILSDTEAANVMLALKAAGDIEGTVAYDPNVEFILEAQGIAGMSGGGVFNSEGQLLGIMVRASDQQKAPKIIRVVKMSYIRFKMLELYNQLPQTPKDKVERFISGEL
ncbi:trypsin-like peptidase domain-containing protein [Pedobacter polaris]|uniref:Trypsin-like peptidase domain-containing protein n=1 Tax=Pedobacter polaris TaxID=2571273 RepID=A0A4U1CIX2_9SPHI|nr:serine protease [Pedobacter polaris]TKC06660.1 trypsin-like peptidase domain-containing protein [Pedobacter polaris]